MTNRALLAMTFTLLFGCVEAQPPVNRVQPNVTRKADIVGGEWYLHQTVVDTPYTADFTFVGETGTLERIVWEVQEEFLVARRAYENVAGAEGEGINGTTDTGGAPVAMYAIQSHFDIRHQYNPVTGERLNVIEENTTDRPWNEREFMRVDWSQNLVSNPNFMMLARYFNGLEMEPVQWYVQDEDDPNAPVFVREDPEDETSRIQYMDITNKMFVRGRRRRTSPASARCRAASSSRSSTATPSTARPPRSRCAAASCASTRPATTSRWSTRATAWTASATSSPSGPATTRPTGSSSPRATASRTATTSGRRATDAARTAS